MRHTVVKSRAGPGLTTITRTFSSGLSDEGGAQRVIRAHDEVGESCGVSLALVARQQVTIAAPGQPLAPVNDRQVTRGRPGG